MKINCSHLYSLMKSVGCHFVQVFWLQFLWKPYHSSRIWLLTQTSTRFRSHAEAADAVSFTGYLVTCDWRVPTALPYLSPRLPGWSRQAASSLPLLVVPPSSFPLSLASHPVHFSYTISSIKRFIHWHESCNELLLHWKEPLILFLQ